MAQARRTRPKAARRAHQLDPAKRVLICLALISGTLVIGTAGYMALGLGFLDALYQAVETVTAVGFSEADLGPSGRLFTILLILAGVGIVLYTLTVVLETLIEGRLTDHLWRRRMQRDIDRKAGHVIVCGCGRLGRAVGNYVTEAGHPVVLVDVDLARLEDTELDFVHGDATDEATLERAGIDRAATLVAALSTDAENVYLTLTARGMRSDILIIARARVDSAEAKLRQAGADRVVNPQFIGGSRAGAMALQPHVAEFVDVVMHDRSLEFRLEECLVSTGSPMAGKTIRDAQIRDQTGALVLALREPGGRFITNPGPDTLVGAGQVLIVIGTEAQLVALGTLSGPA